MTSTPPPLYSPTAPFWMANYMIEQQLRMMQIVTEAMVRANPWMVLIRMGGTDPLTADAAIGKGDDTAELDLEAGGAEAEVPRDGPAPVATPAPAREAPSAANASTAKDIPAAKPAPKTKAEPKAAPKTRPAPAAPKASTASTAPKAASASKASPAPAAPKAASASKASPAPAASNTASAPKASPAPAESRADPAPKTPAPGKRARPTSRRKGAASAQADGDSRGRRQPSTPPAMPDGSAPDQTE